MGQIQNPTKPGEVIQSRISMGQGLPNIETSTDEKAELEQQ